MPPVKSNSDWCNVKQEKKNDSIYLFNSNVRRKKNNLQNQVIDDSN